VSSACRIPSSRRGPTDRARAALACLCTLLTLGTAHAAISVDQTATAVSSSNVSSLTWSHTVGAVANRILLVDLSFRDGNVSATSVTYGGTALTLIGVQNGPGNQNRTEMWRLLAPPSGTANVVVNMSQSKEIVGASVSYAGVNQSSPLGTFACASNTGLIASVAVSSGAGQLVVDTVTANGDAVLLIAGLLQTQLWNTFSGNGDAGNARSGGSTQAGAATTTMSWTLAVPKPWSICAVPLLAATTPSFVNLKTVQVISDPVNGTTNPKYIPGAKAQYTVTITNQGGGSSDSNSVIITDPVPTNTKLFVNDLGGVGSGPVTFTNGSPSSGLTYTFTSLSSSTDDLSFSNNGGASYTYTPTAGADGCDANVTNIQVNPKGTFAPASGGNPSFILTYDVCVK
jgi:uncharacterized repeat protein (TIGR01451 family)